MIRQTLQECINLFNSNMFHQTTAVRGMEQLGEYAVAAVYWRKLGREDDAKACEMLKSAIGKGECYRDAVKPLLEWVDETVEKEIMTESEALKKVYPEMCKLYKKYIG